MLLELVEAVDPQVAPGIGKPWLPLNAALPQCHRLRVVAFAVMKTPQQVLRKIALRQLAQHLYFVQGIGEAYLSAKAVTRLRQQLLVFAIARLALAQAGQQIKRQAFLAVQQRQQFNRLRFGPPFTELVGHGQRINATATGHRTQAL
ncbi:hypothetical protein D3C73_799550 [compost metagenome]